MILPDSAVDPRVEIAVADYLKAQDEGNFLDPETWLSSHPSEIRPALCEFLNVMGIRRSSSPRSSARRPRRTIPKLLPVWGDRYSEGHLVGHGGMGAVYRTVDSVLGRQVAIKVMHPSLAADDAKAARFTAEARIASQLEHPNIVPVHDYGMIPGTPERPYFTMRLVAPQTLADAVAEFKSGPLSDAARDELLRYFLAVCGAIEYAHNRGVLHRDLKPQNVMIGAFGEVQVMDWGLSKAISDSDEPVDSDASIRSGAEESEPGTIRGTLAYMSPEQANAGVIGKTADVFALGGLLAYLHTRRPVYDESDHEELLKAAQTCATGPALAKLESMGTPAELVRLVEKCLAAEPLARSDSAADVAFAVREYLASAEERVRQAEINRGRAEERAEGDRKRLVVERKHRTRQLIGLACLLTLLFSLASGGIWYRYDLENRRLEDEIRAADEQRQATTRVADLNAAIADMYAQIDQDKFGQAAAFLQRAKGRLGSDPPAELVASVAVAETNFKAAVNLDEIRQERGMLKIDNKLPESSSIRRYEEQFTVLGLNPTNIEVGELIHSSPIRRALVIALDDWATAELPSNRASLLMAIAKMADPDPEWGDSFRDPAIRSDRTKLASLAKTALVDKLTIAQIAGLVVALPHDDPTAATLLRVAETKQPYDFWVNLLAAKRYLNKSTSGFFENRANQKDVIGYLRTALATRPDSLGSLLLLSMIYEQENRPDELDGVASRVAQLGRETWISNYIYGLASIKRQKYQLAIKYMFRAAELEPSEETIKLYLALCHYLIGEMDTGRAFAVESAKRWPDSIDSKVIVAYGFVLSGRLEESQNLCLKILRQNPRHEFSRAMLALTLTRQGRISEASKVLETCNPRSIELYPILSNNAMLLDFLRGDFEIALARAQRTSQLAPNYETHILTAHVLTSMGRFSEAKAELKTGSELIKVNGVNKFQVLGITGTLSISFMELHLNNYIEADGLIGNKLPYPNNINGAESNVFKRTLSIASGELLYAKRFYASSAKSYEIGLNNTLNADFIIGAFPGNKIMGARAATQAWMGAGTDAIRTSPADRALFLKNALRWLKEDLANSSSFVNRKQDVFAKIGQLLDSENSIKVNSRLSIIKMHRDFAPLRNPQLLEEMSEEDRKAAEAIWAETDALYKKLNPPLDIP